MGLQLEAWPAEATDQFIEIVKSIERHHGFCSGGEASLRLHLTDLMTILSVPIQSDLHTLFLDHVLRRVDIKLEPHPEQPPRMAEGQPTATSVSNGAYEPTADLTSVDRLLSESGQVDAATTECRELVAEKTRYLAIAAGMCGEIERMDMAITYFRGVLADQVRDFGVDHPDTLTTRTLLAHCLGESGQVEQAITDYRQLLADQLRDLGDDHPDTLTTKLLLTYATSASHRYGSNAADALTTSTLLVHWLGVSGQMEDAITQFQRLRAAQRRAMGANHGDALTTHRLLAHWLGASGRVEEAITELRWLRADDHRYNSGWWTRTLLAHWLGSSGQVGKAIFEFRWLLADLWADQSLGDHSDTLTTRRNLAHWVAVSGRVDKAINKYRKLLADQERVLGANHPDTLTTRHDLDCWLSRSR